MAGLNKKPRRTQEQNKPVLPKLIPTSPEELRGTVAPAAKEPEKIFRHTLRIPASLENRFMDWYKDQVAAGRPKSEISFNTFVSEAMDKALKIEGYN